jgi:hypothetical protein
MRKTYLSDGMLNLIRAELSKSGVSDEEVSKRISAFTSTGWACPTIFAAYRRVIESVKQRPDL